MNYLFLKSNYNLKGCFGLFYSAIMEVPYIAQVLMFCGVEMYDKTKQEVL